MLNYVRISPSLEAWDTGQQVKVQLGRQLGVSRAGLVEGEGNISINGRSLTLRIKMGGDHDVVSHAASLMGARVDAVAVTDPPTWLAQINSSTAAEWIMTLY